ncbi:MAG: ATP-binding protein [Rhodospirillaceae bacterium]|nr:ATP-binding protein [Rhodospirillaceae bacterium]
MLEFNQTQSSIRDNPWWKTGAIGDRVRRLSARPFLGELEALLQSGNELPILLAGPTGAGKSVLLLQLIQKLLSKGVAPRRIIKISFDLPSHTQRTIEGIVKATVQAAASGPQGGYFIFLDAVDAVQGWEQQIYDLSVANPEWQIIAASSVAPLFKSEKKHLSVRDAEKASGGFFAGLILPPVTFAEFVQFQNLRTKIFDVYGKLSDMDALNAAFLDYIEWGGFVETVMGGARLQVDTSYLAGIGVNKGSAGIYGIGDASDLSRIYAYLVQGTAAEFSMEGLANKFSIAKNTIRKYLDYLEASYLIRRIWRLDENAKKFSRQTRFKVYLINPSHRAALFGMASVSDEVTARVSETAVISQFVHTKSISRLFYAGWKSGSNEHRVALVEMPVAGHHPVKCIEIDWSDRALALPQKVLADMITFMDRANPATPSKVLTRTIPGKRFVGEHEIGFLPVAVWCWAIGKDLADRAV